ncbi:MAG: hypothetical protein WCR30_03925 [Clostridia bacterium]
MFVTSMLGGIFDGLKDWITGFFNLFPKLLYLLVTMIYGILDIFQCIFRKVAGLETVYYLSEDGTTVSIGEDGSDIILTILNNSQIKDAIIAMIVLAFVLVFIFTIIAILKTEFNAEDAKSASKTKVVGKSIKAMISFFLVPAICYMGLFLSNVIIIALDRATTQTTDTLDGGSLEVFEPGYYYDVFGTAIATNGTPLSGLAFKSAAFNANRIRTNDAFANAIALDGETDGNGITFGKTFMPSDNNSSENVSGQELAAENLDNAFANSYILKTGKQASINERIDKISDADAKEYLHSFSKIVILDEGDSDRSIGIMSKFRVNLVWFYYDLWKFDFVLGLGIAIVLTVIMLNITLAVMKRVFDLIILTIVAPPIAATMPLDNGDTFKKWRVKYVAKSIQAYAPVVAMNLFFLIVPFINDFSFIGTTIGGEYKSIAAADYIVQSFFVIVGLVAVKDLTKMLSEIVGSEDANATGNGMSGEVVGTALKTASVMSKGTKTAAGAFIAPVKALGKRYFTGYKEGNEAKEKYLKEHEGDYEGANQAYRDARVKKEKKNSFESMKNSVGSTLRDTIDLPKFLGKQALGSTPYGKEFETASKSGYGFNNSLNNITGGLLNKLPGLPIGKSKFFQGKESREMDKKIKDEEKAIKIKREAEKNILKEDNKKADTSVPASSNNTSAPQGGTQTSSASSQFGNAKAEKAQRIFDQYFGEVNKKIGKPSNYEYDLSQIKGAQEKALQEFKDSFNARVNKGRFDESQYKAKLETEIKKYMATHKYIQKD